MPRSISGDCPGRTNAPCNPRRPPRNARLPARRVSTTTAAEVHMKGLDGKVAIVTGGGSGLGEAIGKALAGRGVKVVLSDIKLDGAERVAREITSAGRTASAIQQD